MQEIKEDDMPDKKFISLISCAQSWAYTFQKKKIQNILGFSLGSEVCLAFFPFLTYSKSACLILRSRAGDLVPNLSRLFNYVRRKPIDISFNGL